MEWPYEVMRGICAFGAGLILSLAGSSVQHVTQNDLASPSTLGMEAFMVLVVLFTQVVGISWGGLPYLEFISFGLSLVGLLFILLSLKFLKKSSAEIVYGQSEQKMERWILLGLCLNFFAGALFSLTHFVFTLKNWPLPGSLWFGHFRYATLNLTLIMLVIMFIYWCWGRRLAKRLGPLSFGSEFALGLGIPVAEIQREALAFSFIGVAFVSACFGPFTFYSLLLPHLLRKVFKLRGPFAEMSWAPVVAGVLLLALDSVCEFFTVDSAEIPVGMVSSLLGSLCFVLILLRERRSNES